MAFATALSFGAGVGSTLFYLQAFKGETALAALPLIEADKAPTRVRPEGFDAAGPRLAQPSSLPSPISSAMAAAVADPTVDLAPQGIPAAPELVPPVAAVVLELAPPIMASAGPPPMPVAAIEPDHQEPQFRLQLASMRTLGGANEELSRLKRLHANLLVSVELAVERIDQGTRGVFYRVLSGAIGDRPEANEFCTAIAQKRGQCAVIALSSPSRTVAETRSAAVPVAAPVAMQQGAAIAAPVAEPATQVAPIVAASPASTVVAARNNGGRNGTEIRAQLGSMRSMEGANREVARLSRIYGGTLGTTELSVSRIDQGERGVFYRILTAPLPSRDAGADLCQRLGATHQAGCVLIPGRPTA